MTGTTVLEALLENITRDLSNMPTRKAGTPWHTDRLREANRLTRAIQAEEKRRRPQGWWV